MVGESVFLHEKKIVTFLRTLQCFMNFVFYITHCIGALLPLPNAVLSCSWSWRGCWNRGRTSSLSFGNRCTTGTRPCTHSGHSSKTPSETSRLVHLSVEGFFFFMLNWMKHQIFRVDKVHTGGIVSVTCMENSSLSVTVMHSFLHPLRTASGPRCAATVPAGEAAPARSFTWLGTPSLLWGATSGIRLVIM